MKLLKFIFLFTIIFISYNAFSQELKKNKKRFEIVFRKKPIIQDKELFLKSIKFKANELFGLAKLDEVMNNDSISKEGLQKLNELTNPAEQFLLNEIQTEYKKNNNTFHLKVKDLLAIHFKKSGDQIIGDFFVIDNETKSSYFLAKKDSSTIFLKKKLSDININWKEEVKEFRNDKKIINGFNCFKIEYIKTKKISNQIEERTKYILYVTQKIDIKNHPLFKNDLILNKYYPLYIEEYMDGIQGAKITYNIDKFFWN
ncbi:hypothetical protein T190611E02C_10831 [Tenacibaculum sp. 190524A05c]|uniref:hypothetical protein n=1 Tax=Tenacibaculum platacis TaxID=3137852 RepID=UPI0031FB2008